MTDSSVPGVPEIGRRKPENEQEWLELKARAFDDPRLSSSHLLALRCIYGRYGNGSVPEPVTFSLDSVSAESGIPVRELRGVFFDLVTTGYTVFRLAGDAK